MGIYSLLGLAEAAKSDPRRALAWDAIARFRKFSSYSMELLSVSKLPHQSCQDLCYCRIRSQCSFCLMIRFNLSYRVGGYQTS